MEFREFRYRNFIVRKAEPGEGEVIHRLMQELCDYENLSFEFRASPADLENILFNLRCGDALLVYDNESDGIIGVMLLSYNYSSFNGRPGIFIEDFYIREPFRRHGIGTAMLTRLKWLAKEQGFGRIDWLCLKSNTSSVDFYRSCGARTMDDWLLFRLTDEDFER